MKPTVSRKRKIDDEQNIQPNQKKQKLVQKSITAFLQDPNHTTTLQKIISGGQTGADQAAIEIARKLNIPTGGTCTVGYITSDGPNYELRDIYGLVEITKPARITKFTLTKMYIERSKANVDNSNATVAFCLKTSAGTEKTIGYCRTGKWKKSASDICLYRPCLVINDLSDDNFDINVNKIVEFVQEYAVKILNVAGHRDRSIRGMDFKQKVKDVLNDAFLRLT
eukprot:TRINITY_DN1891_c0_g1_i1.p1 TRINITY_DN1891_c0_g1~~TRINITY_DN1891_c0_g1_i1.p1  ORF type:complete len:224 (+),score=36.18 TRINITY_DN1891_c0_g1_i1:13-684(+)